MISYKENLSGLEKLKETCVKKFTLEHTWSSVGILQSMDVDIAKDDKTWE